MLIGSPKFLRKSEKSQRIKREKARKKNGIQG